MARYANPAAPVLPANPIPDDLAARVSAIEAEVSAKLPGDYAFPDEIGETGEVIKVDDGELVFAADDDGS